MSEYLITDQYRSCWWFSVDMTRQSRGQCKATREVRWSYALTLPSSRCRLYELGFNNCSQIIQQNKQEQVGVDLVWLKTQVMKLHFWIEAWQYPKSKLHHLFFELRFHIGGRTCKACIKIVKLSYNIRPNPTGSGNTVHVKNKGNFLLGIWVDVHSFFAG